jgi:hypothetical protein
MFILCYKCTTGGECLYCVINVQQEECLYCVINVQRCTFITQYKHSPPVVHL